MVNTKIEVKKTLLLEFELPGVTYTSRGSHSNESQLEQRFGETWQMRVTPENALETAETLTKIAAAIVAAMKSQ